MKHIRWGALVVGVFLACVTGYVMFKDVLDGAPVNTGHALSLAALVVALAAFHMVPRSGILSGIALAVLGLGASSYIVISSGSRNAETALTKAATVDARNAIRERAEAELNRAESDLGAARTSMARECATGRGKNCRGDEATVAIQEKAVADARRVLDSAPPEIDANGGFVQTARVIAAIVGGDTGKIETKLELLTPFLVVLIVELGTVTFLHVGLGSPTKPRVPRVEPDMEPAKPAPLPANDVSPTDETGDVISWVRAFRARHGRNPQIPELQAQFQVPKTTAWRRIKSA